MPGSYGNYNLYQAAASAYINYSTASEAVTLPVGTVAVTCAATTKCWVKVGYPGETVTSAAPSGEKVWVNRLFAINAGDRLDVAVPISTDAALVQIAVIRDTVDGVLDITARKE